MFPMFENPSDQSSKWSFRSGSQLLCIKSMHLDRCYNPETQKKSTEMMS